MGGGKSRYSKRISTHQPRATYHQRYRQFGGKPAGSYRPKPSRRSSPSFLDSLFSPPKGKRKRR